MSLKRRTPEQEKKFTGTFDNLDCAGNDNEFDLRLVYVADLGLHVNEYQGEKKPDVQKISLGFEVIGFPSTLTDEDGTETVTPRILWLNPFNIFKKLTEKGKEIIYYKVFDKSAQPLEDADWDAQLGKACVGTVINVAGTGKNEGKVFDSLVSISMMPKRMADSVPMNETATDIGDADDPENAVTKGLYGLVKYVYEQRITSVEDDSPDNDDDIYG